MPPAGGPLDDDRELLHDLSDRETFETILVRAFGLSDEEARHASANLFHHFLDARGVLLDRVVDEGDPAYFSREDRRDLVALQDLGLVAVRSAEVEKADAVGRTRTFTQYHYALHLDAIRQRLVEAVRVAEAVEAPEASDVYDDPSVWERRRAPVGG